MRISLLGDTVAKLVAASESSLGAYKAGRIYDLAFVRLVKVACPRELTASKENKMNLPLVVERNRHRYGMIDATGYYPPAVVVAGEYRREHLMCRGYQTAAAWVERGALEINADDAIGCGELTEKLSNLIQQKIYGNNKPIMGQPWPYVFQVYPFENYLIYEFAGQKYRQGFVLDPITRDVALSGESVKVMEKFVNAGADAGMPRTQDGMRQVRNPLPLAGNWVSSRGGESSDLVTMVVRNYSNVKTVVGKMLAAIKTGLYTPLKPDFAPVNLSSYGKILGPLVEAGVAPADFVVWADRHGQQYMDAREFSDKQRKKLAKKGEAMPGGGFPIANLEDLKNAKRAIGRAKNRAATIRHINKRAKALGAPGFGESSTSSEDEVDAFGLRKRTFGGFKNPKKGKIGDPKKVTFKV